LAHILNIDTFTDNRGTLSVIEDILPFDIKRVYYIYDVSGQRGGHRHIKTIQALIVLNGSCEIFINNGIQQKTIQMNSPSECLIMEPKDWHTMDKFSKDAILLVLSSELYDSKDYITKGYE